MHFWCFGRRGIADGGPAQTCVRAGSQLAGTGATPPSTLGWPTSVCFVWVSAAHNARGTDRPPPPTLADGSPAVSQQKRKGVIRRRGGRRGTLPRVPLARLPGEEGDRRQQRALALQPAQGRNSQTRGGGGLGQGIGQEGGGRREGGWSHTTDRGEGLYCLVA